MAITFEAKLFSSGAVREYVVINHGALAFTDFRQHWRCIGGK